jgi:hypothetical protein
MSWFRNLFGGRRPSRSASRPFYSRLRLEDLEGRLVPNASVAFSAQGAMVEVVTYDNGSLVLFDSLGAHTLVDPSVPGATPVRVAHAFRDQSGGVGIDVVYQTGLAFEYDSTHAVFMGPNVLDLSRVYGANGDFRLYVVYGSGGGFGNLATGSLVEFSPTAVRTLLTSNVSFATGYLDPNGQFGLAEGTIDGSANSLVTTADSTGTQVLYNGSAVITQCVGDYDRTTDPSGGAFINVVFNPGNSGPGSLGSPHTGVQFSSQGEVGLGFNVKPL